MNNYKGGTPKQQKIINFKNLENNALNINLNLVMSIDKPLEIVFLDVDFIRQFRYVELFMPNLLNGSFSVDSIYFA